ncbi:MAG: hypothetical protein M1837_006392 [Sclerophora amabilis]|nr:MAG: hypothetical protein M1837_006392 [Sclerophora amabilis]
MASHFTPYFSVPFNEGRLPPTYRAALYKSKKRKRGDDASLSSSDPDSQSSSPPGSPKTPSNGAVASGFTPVNQPQNRFKAERASAAVGDVGSHAALQYRVAGQRLDKPAPSYPFPHRAHASPLVHGGDQSQQVTEDLATLNPPLLAAGTSISSGPRDRLYLRQHHLSVITTVLHRCLLAGDYVRAGRAWGLILRSEAGGRPVNLGGQGRWGIGAEILMRRDGQVRQESLAQQEQRQQQQQQQQEGSDSSVSDVAPSEEKRQSEPSFTEEGFAQAKDYYERLILQYPYSKRRPDSVNALDFYPAMFGLWIYVTQERLRATERRTRHADARSSPPSSTRSESADAEQHSANDQDELARVQSITLQEATAISTRLDDLLSSPPFSDSAPLWHLRGMVALWVGSLRSPAGNENSDARSKSALTRGNTEEHAKARDAFRRAKQGGGPVWEGIPKDFLDDSDNDDGGV